MAKQLYANNATGYLNATINASQTSIVLQSGNGSAFPSPTGGDYFLVTLYDPTIGVEIVKVTARSTDTLTVVRGQESTTASAFPNGSVVESRATKGTFENLAQKTGDSVTDLTIGTLTLTNDLSVANGGTGASDAATARTNLGLGNVDDTSDATKNSASVTLTNKTIAAATNVVEARSGPNTSPFSFRNKIINGNFAINQRGYVSGAAVGSGLYGHDRWKQAASGDTYTFSTTANKTTVTIPSGKVLKQVIEGLNLQSGTYVLSWEGTAQGKIGGGSYGATGITGSITGGTDTTIEFGPGTVTNVQLELGSIATPFEHRPYGLELSLCQRYFWTLPSAFHVNSYAGSVGQPTNSFLLKFPVTMRTTPTNVVVSESAGINVNTPSRTISAEGIHWFGTAIAPGYVYFLANFTSASAEL